MTSNASSGTLREAMSCSVCREDYDQARKKPLFLPCGHTFCRSCLVTLRGSVHIQCPSCKRQHNVQVETLAVNYSLLNIMPLCAELKYEECTAHCDDLRYWCSTCGKPLCTLCLHSGHPQAHSVKLTQVFVRDEKLKLKEKLTRFYSILDDERTKLRKDFNKLDIWVRELFRRNADMHNTAAEHNELHAQIEKANDITSIKDLEKTVEDFCRIGEKKLLMANLMALTINDPREAAKLPQPTTLRTQEQESLNTSQPTTLRTQEQESLNTTQPTNHRAQQQESLNTSQPTTLRAQQQESIKSSQQTRETTQARGAVMDFRDGRLLLHSFAEPDSRSLSLQMPSEVFLELSVGDMRLGYVYITLWSHMRLAQQFLALCMGTMEPLLLGIKAHGKVRDVIVFRFGDEGAGQETLFGCQTSRSPLLKNLEWGGQYTKPEAEGYIMRIDKSDGLAFGICTKKHPNVMVEAPFGEVVAGLEVTRIAFLHNLVTRVTVTHCGLAMPRLPLLPSEPKVLSESAEVSSQRSSSSNFSKTGVPTDQNCKTQ